MFDDPNLLGSAGLVPVMRLAALAGLSGLADRLFSVPTDKGANAGAKVASLVAGMVAGADSIDDTRAMCVRAPCACVHLTREASLPRDLV